MAVPIVPRGHRFGYIGAYGGHTVVALPWNIFAAYQHADVLVRDEQLLVFVIVVAGAIMLVRRERTRLAGLCAIVPPLVGAVVWALGKPVFDPRNFMAAAPFMAIAAAAPLRSLRARRLRVIAAAVVVAGMAALVASTQLQLGRTPYDAVAHRIADDGWRYSAPIVFFGPNPTDMKIVTWSLPHRQWMVRGVGAKGVCTDVYAIVENGAGRRWLARASRSATARTTTFPASRVPRGPARAAPGRGRRAAPRVPDGSHPGPPLRRSGVRVCAGAAADPERTPAKALSELRHGLVRPAYAARSTPGAGTRRSSSRAVPRAAVAWLANRRSAWRLARLGRRRSVGSSTQIRPTTALSRSRSGRKSQCWFQALGPAPFSCEL